MILGGHVEVHAAGHASILHQYAQNRARDHQLGHQPECAMRPGTHCTRTTTGLRLKEGLVLGCTAGRTEDVARSTYHNAVGVWLWLGDGMYSSTVAAVWGDDGDEMGDVLV